jgi:hypothetical protein
MVMCCQVRVLNQLPINHILMGLIIYFMFEVQINYMWFLDIFKVNETLHVVEFYLYVVFIFPKIVYTIPCIYPCCPSTFKISIQ